MKKKSVIISLVFFGLFIVLSILMLCGLTKGFDEAVYNLVRCLRCDFFDKYFVFITKFGNESTVIVLVIVFLLLLKNRYRVMMLLMPLVCAISNQLLKYLVRRPRPDVLKLIEQGGYSYPSGHSMISVSVYGLVLYCVLKQVNNKYLKYGLCFLLVLLIISIGVSRIYVGVHYASDVLGGFMLATAELVLLVNFTKTYRGN